MIVIQLYKSEEKRKGGSYSMMTLTEWLATFKEMSRTDYDNSAKVFQETLNQEYDAYIDYVNSIERK